MKNELSWMPLATGSDAIRAFGGMRYATDQTEAILKHNVDRKREAGNLAGFISGSMCCPQSKHKHARIVNAAGCRFAKSAIEDAAAMQYFYGRCRSRFTSLNLSSH